MKFFTSDLHIGEQFTPSQRPRYYKMLENLFMIQCYERISRDDDLYLVGDLICELKDLEFFKDLPICNLHIICGNRETRIPNFADEAERILTRHRDRLEVFSGIYDVEISGEYWRVAHDHRLLAGHALPKPAICGHVHKFWGVKRLPNGFPIINVGVDIWNYDLVTEDILTKCYQEVMTGRYDDCIDFPR